MKQIETLIGTTEFVKNNPVTSTFDTDQGDWYCKELEILESIRNYANFLSQPPKLGMFIPCDENDVPLEKPCEEMFEIKANQKCSGWKYLSNENGNERYYDHVSFIKAVTSYHNALDRILFEGIVATQDMYGTTKREFWHIGNLRIAHRLTYRSGNVELNLDFIRKHKDLESLTPYNLKLTQTAKNKIYDGNI